MQLAAPLVYGQHLIIPNFEDPSFGSATDLSKSWCLWCWWIDDPCFYVVQISAYNCNLHWAKLLHNISL